jgi:hypothetical protein
MTAYSWTGVSGDWDVAANWSPSGGPPTLTDTATIGGTGTYTVTVDTDDVAKSLTLSDPNATVVDDGVFGSGNPASLTISGTFSMCAGTFNLSHYVGGSLTVGALNLSGGALTINGGGQLNLNGALSQTGGTLTLNGGTIYATTLDSTAGTLALNVGTLTGATVTNSGTIDAEEANGNLTIDPTTFINSGTIDVLNGDSITIGNYNVTLEPTTFTTTASSVIAIGSNSSAYIQPNNAWTNLGSITLASGAGLYLYGPMSAASLGKISNSGGTVYVAGTWDNTGQTLDGSAGFGQLALYGGTISGGTATAAGVAFTRSGTLSGVTFDGPLNLTSDHASVDLANGTTVVGSSGSGPGTINVTGTSSSLYFDNAQSVDNETINLGNASSLALLASNDVNHAGNQVLTLGSGVSIDTQGAAGIGDSGLAGDGIVNDGVINATAGGYFQFYGNAFTNNGTINDASNGNVLEIYSTTFTNQGAINIGLALIVGNTTTFTNATGTITVDGTGSLELDEALTTAQLGTIKEASGATLDFAGGLNNSGATLNLAAGVLLEGTIDGGTIDGPINLTASRQTLHLAGGPTVNNAAGTGPGTINVTASLYFDNTQTFNNATINLGNASNFASLYSNDVGTAGNQVLTLGSGVTIDIVGYAQIADGGYAGDGIINEGVINDTPTNGRLIIAGNSFTNEGTINVSLGEYALSIGPATFIDDGKISGKGILELSGPSATIGAGASFSVAYWTVAGTAVTLGENLTYAGTFSADAGTTLNLSGGNLTLRGTDSFAGATTSGSKKLTAKGTTTLSGLTIGGTTTFSDAGSLSETGGSAILGDAAGDVARLTIASTGTWDILDDSVIGRGTSASSSITNSGLLEKTRGTGVSAITPKVTNNGVNTGGAAVNGGVCVSSGTLDFNGAVTGGTVATPGTDTISGASSVLEFDSTVASSKTIGSQDIVFNGGTLDLTKPTNFWGEISNFAAGDTIDLLGKWSFLSFSEVSGVGELTLASGAAKHTFDFVGITQNVFNIASGSTTVITHT